MTPVPVGSFRLAEDRLLLSTVVVNSAEVRGARNILPVVNQTQLKVRGTKILIIRVQDPIL